MMRTILLAAAFTATLTTVAAADEHMSYALLATDNMATCGGFINKTIGQQDLAAAWVAGFVSGANQADAGHPMAGRNWSHTDVRTWLRAWCMQHPLMPMSTAAVQLRADLIATHTE